MGNGMGRVYKHNQTNWPYLSPNTTFYAPPHSVPSPQNYSTSDCGAARISLHWPSPISKLTTTNQVDIEVNNDDDSESF